MARKAAAATSTSDDAAAPRRSGRIAAIPSAVQETAKKVVKKATGKKRGADGEGDAGANKKVCFYVALAWDKGGTDVHAVVEQVKADDEPADGAVRHTSHSPHLLCSRSSHLFVGLRACPYSRFDFCASRSARR